MKEIGGLASGETPNADEIADAFARLNMVVDSWAAERLTIYTTTRTTWTITASDGEYTLGLTGNIAVARPVYITDLNIIDTSQSPDQEIDLGKVLTHQEYADIPDKALTADQPSRVYYNPTYPLGTVTFWPVPTSSTLQGVIYTDAPLTQFASTATTLVLPPGYELALLTNLAINLGPSFGRPTQDLINSAKDSKAVIKLANYRPIPMHCDPALVGGRGVGYDINIGAHRP